MFWPVVLAKQQLSTFSSYLQNWERWGGQPSQYESVYGRHQHLRSSFSMRRSLSVFAWHQRANFGIERSAGSPLGLEESTSDLPVDYLGNLHEYADTIVLHNSEADYHVRTDCDLLKALRIRAMRERASRVC